MNTRYTHHFDIRKSSVSYSVGKWSFGYILGVVIYTCFCSVLRYCRTMRLSWWLCWWRIVVVCIAQCCSSIGTTIASISCISSCSCISSRSYRASSCSCCVSSCSCLSSLYSHRETRCIVGHNRIKCRCWYCDTITDDSCLCRLHRNTTSNRWSSWNLRNISCIGIS